jgi:hypothetical protein
VPDRKTSSCLDSEFPGTGLQKGGCAGPGPPTLGKRVSWNPAGMGKHERRPGRARSARDEGESAANRVRRLLSLFTKYFKEVTHNISLRDHCFFLSGE